MLRTQTGRFAIQAFAAPIKALFIAVILYFGSGCSSSTKSADAKEQSAAGRRDTGHKVDINCLGDHVSNPSDSFHYSFKVTDEQNAVDKEADVTPQTMVVTIQDKSGSHTYHGARSDEGSWGRAVLDLSGSGLTVMTARVAFIEDSSALRRIGDEPMNGYSTTQYSIDTTSGNTSDAQTFRTMFGAASYDKGTVWVGAGGCPVKLILDEVTQRNNGSIDKHHFEIAVSKK